MKKYFIIIIFFTFLFQGYSQIEPKNEKIFIELIYPDPMYKFGDTLLIDSLEYIFDKKHRFNDFSIVKRQDKIGVIDHNCNFIIHPTNLKSIRFESFGIILNNDKYMGLSDYKGNVILPIQMLGIYHFYDDVVHYVNNQNRQKLFFLKDTSHSQSDFCNIKGFSKMNNLVLLSQDCINFGIINLESINETISYIYQNPSYLYFNGLKGWILSHETKFGVLNENKKILLPFIYNEIHNYKNFFIVKKDNKWGIVDSENSSIVSVKFKSIVSIGFEDIFVVNLEDKFGVINLKEEIIIPIEFDDLKLDYDKDVYVAKHNNKIGVIDKNNKVIIPFNYDYLYDNGVGGYIVSNEGNYGVLSYRGKEIIPIKYFQINTIIGNPQYPESGFHVLNESLKSSFFDKSGVQKTKFVFDYYEIEGRRQPVKVGIKNVTFFVNSHGECVGNCPDEYFLKKFGLRK